jgi:hypothetical protein
MDQKVLFENVAIKHKQRLHDFQEMSSERTIEIF